MRALHLLSGALFFFSLQASAGNLQLTKPDPQCRCESQPNDEFDDAQAFSVGPFKGQCVDSCRFRAAQFLSISNYKSLTPKTDEVLVANVLHNQKFYVAAVNFNNFTHAQVGFEEFRPGVFHVFLKFVLDERAEPIVLKSQQKDDVATAVTRSLVISSEGVPPKGHRYNLVDGFFEKYLLAHRITTDEESIRWISSFNSRVYYHDLNLNPQDVGLIMKSGFQASVHDKLNSIYKLLSNNCATAALGFVLKGRQMKSSWLFDFDRALPISGPMGTLAYLKRLGLVSEPKLPVVKTVAEAQMR